ncbi:MAG: hypothetical protein ACI9KE_003047 [Polyangiales bacterium]|jgi:hypothetical protein
MTEWFKYAGMACVIFAGCGDDSGRTGDASPGTDSAMSCTSDPECDDGFACTIDSCGVGGVCSYVGIDERCDGEEVCAVGRGCVDEASCTADTECDDGFECTLDRCGVGGVCAFTPVNELCEGPGATCDPTTGMAGSGCTEATGCTIDEQCDDGHDCTLDSCGVDNVCDFTAVNERCADGETCTASGCFASMPCTMDEECDDGDFCNGTEICNAEFGCQPAPAPRECNDSDACTIDSCSTASNACVFACDSSMEACGCPMAETPCDGIFDVTPPPTQRCASLIPPAQVEYNVSEVEFACIGMLLSVDGRNIPTMTGNTPMTQSPRASDDTFSVQTEVGGGCTETYRIEGRFVDADNFEGTWSAQYTNTNLMIDECALSGCVNQSAPVTGVRR